MKGLDRNISEISALYDFRLFELLYKLNRIGLNDRPINAIIRGERQRNFQEKRRGANQSNLLNIQVDIFAAKTTSHGTLHSTIHGNNSQKSKVSVAHLNVRSLKTREQ